MYPVSGEYKEKIKGLERTFKASVQIQHSKGVLNLTDKDIVANSIIYTEGSQAGEEFTIGGTVASDISIGILNKIEYEDINFMGARITGTISLLIKEGSDAHFLQPSQPSKMPNTDDLWEDVPLGRFNIDEVNKQRNTIELKAIDNMINLDISYSLSKLSYPATLYQIYTNICNVADVQIGTVDFPNKNYIVINKPDGELSLRDVLGYVAELSGTFAKFNRLGALELTWYKSTGITLDPSNRFNFKASDNVVQIKGIMASVEDTTYLTGTQDYAIDLTDNPLLQGEHATVLPSILDNVKDTIFTPYTSNWQGNMAIQAGDLITQIDRDGKAYNTLITKSIYKYRGKSTLEAKGLPEISKGYRGSTNRKIAQIKRVVEKEVGDKLTSLEQAQLNATELIANMLGGYIIEDKPNGIFYIADNPNIDLAQKVWKYGINGFGYSSTGVNGIYTTAITADGSIVAMLVSANIITANMVQTGTLTSTDNSSWLNLDDGSFNFKNALVWSNGQLLIQSPSIPEATDLSSINQNISDIKSLKPNNLVGGTTTIDNTKVRVNHGSTSEYSEINSSGFVRQYANGQAEYLNGIWITEVTYSNQYGGSRNKPTPVRVNLPLSFKGRGASTKLLLTNTGFKSWPEGNDRGNGNYLYYIVEITTKNFDADVPYVDVLSYLEYSKGVITTIESLYRETNFILLLIGS